MRKYNITFEMFHESFRGYDHRDGPKVVSVEARNQDSAIKKAKREIDKHCKNRVQSMWGKLKNIEEVS